MKRFIWILIMCPLGVLGQHNLRVMTYNIRYHNPSDGIDIWSNRKQFLISFLNQQNIDILGLQEVLNDQLLDLESGLNAQNNKYQWVGVGRDDGDKKGEYAPIFFKSSKFSLTKSGYFWISPTPNQPSKGWDAVCVRICTYAILKSKQDQQNLAVFNVHLDHIGKQSRTEGLILLKNAIDSLAEGIPVLLTGDFNTTLADSSMQIFREFQSSSNFFNPQVDYTFSTFDPKAKHGEMIDYIFLINTSFKQRRRAMILKPVLKNGRYLSDHFPVLWKVKI